MARGGGINYSRRPCPGDFESIFVEHGHAGCASRYRAGSGTIARWLKERGRKRLLKKRAAHVAQQRQKNALGYRDGQVVAFLLRHYAEHWRPPTYAEIMNGVGINTKGEVSRIINRIERRGIVSRPRRPKL